MARRDPLSPLPERPYLRDAVYTAVRERILSDGRMVGRLREAQIAAALGVSRTPVREALSRLAQEGIVTSEPHRGVRLVQVTLADYLDWCELREALEGQAARLAASRADGAVVGRLRRLMKPFEPGRPVRKPADYAAANAEFHATVFEIAASPALSRAVEVFRHVDRAKLGLIEKLNRGETSWREHQRIIDAIDRRDADAAEREARDHIRSFKKAVAEQAPDPFAHASEGSSQDGKQRRQEEPRNAKDASSSHRARHRRNGD